MTKHQLIGAEVSLYTGKLRCYLQYKNIPFDEVVASGEVYRDTIIPRTGVRYIPVLITDDDQALQDTTEIIDYLERRYVEAPVYPSTPFQKLIALLLEVYGDEWLVIPAMHYRWNIEENKDFAVAEFGRTSVPDASAEEQLIVGKKMSGPFAGSLPVLGVSDTNTKAIETSYLGLLKELDRHFKATPFLLGTRPCIGDFGLIGPLYAHLYRDPYSGRLMQEQAPNVVAWVNRMINPDPLTGDFLPDDQVPETLMPVLQRMFREQGPVIRSTLDRVAEWASVNADGKAEQEISRAIGSHTFTVEGAEAERLVFPYCQWMWQRPYDCYQGMNEENRTTVERRLAVLPGALELLRHPVTQRVVRKNNRLLLG
ncbi:glutathione S-transferase family protein [Ketobacter sp.]